MELVLTAVAVLIFRGATAETNTDFVQIPDDFLIGTGTSAYQVEGAWNQSGKGLSIWDKYVHEHPGMILDGATGDVSTDSYHKYKEDVKILKQLHVNFYRFSISWSRIFPKGLTNEINEDGVDYYNKLIDELIENNITCVVAMHQWDLPQALQDLGGWANPLLVDLFEDYAGILFRKFGDRVKMWITIVEPETVAQGYNASRHLAPGVDSPLLGKYLATHNLIKAHSQVYRMYKTDFHTQRGMVGIALNSRWFEPLDNSSSKHKDAAERAIEFELGMFANPIFSKEGDYPQIVKDTVSEISQKQNYHRSRLRTFTVTEIQTIKGSYDFLGLNYYTTRLVVPGTWSDPKDTPDNQVNLLVDRKWPNSSSPDVQVVPWGIRKLLKWVKNKYDSPKIFITENGYPDHGEERDTDRVKYIVSHMSEIMKAKNEDGCDVIGYTAWSLMDSFEWDRGYRDKYGLYKVNLSDPVLERKPKSSAYDLSEICLKRKLPIYFLRVTGEIDVNLTFFDNEKNLTKLESIKAEPTSSSPSNHISPIMYVWFALIIIYTTNKINL